MNTDNLSDLEGDLRALRPRAPSDGFADHVAVESRIRALKPRAPSAGFADRVVAAGQANVLTFPRPRGLPLVLRIAAGLTAAIAIAITAGTLVTPGAPQTNTVTAHATPPAATAYACADDGTVLPVINLSNGSALRPRLRRSEGIPTGFRATPGGSVVPVSYGAPSTAVEYAPVQYE